MSPYYQTHIFCCTNRRPDGHDSGCCASKGSERLQAYMKRKAKELNLPETRVNQSGCLGRCDLGIALVIYPAGVWYSVKTETDIDDILTQHVQQGKTVERLLMPQRA